MTRLIIWFLFFFSGACALVYEVLWMRHLGLILGNTVHSMSAVLSAFMAGLALGSFLAGRYLSKRSHLLMLYGLLEIAIGVYCLLLPWLFDAATPLYAQLYAEEGGPLLSIVRFVISFTLLLVPTTFMGATLPLLSQFLVKSPQGLSRTAGTLYAINTLGAVFGAAGAGFILLPTLGRVWSNATAVIANISLGLLALALAFRERSKESSAPTTTVPDEATNSPTPAKKTSDTESTGAQTSDSESDQSSAFTIRAAVAIFGITGGAAMATQIGWTRALTLALGSSTYAFSLIVSIFILGLALGGAWGARYAQRAKDPAASLGQIMALIGVLNMALVTLLGWAPLLFFWLISVGSQWGFGTLMLIEALGVGAFLIVPTFLMGSIMPLTLHIARNRAIGPGGAGRTVGSLYAVNTVGSIVGSLIGGLVLLPLVQIQATLKLTALLYAFPGLALFRLSNTYLEGRRRYLAGLLVAAAFVLALLPSWDVRQMSSGAYLMRSRRHIEAARRGDFLKAIPYKQDTSVLYHREGAAATVTVTQDDGLTLSIGGKPDASSTWDMSTQVGLTLIPQLIHTGGAEELLVIGMGSGVSLGAALSSKRVKHIDLLEISPEVMEASWFFKKFSGLKYASDVLPAPLQEPKVHVLINDARNHLQMTQRRYDVISSEPSNPWIAGIGNLFTREAFELCKSRLKDGGIMCQWLHRYGMAEREFKSILATFSVVFPHTQVWCVLPGSDYLLVGSNAQLSVPLQALQARLEEPRVRAFLQRVNFHQPSELLACFYADTEHVKSLGAGAEIHTDDNMLLEFSGPRTQIEGHILFRTANWRVSPERMLDYVGLSEAEKVTFKYYLDRSLMGRWLFEMGRDNIGRMDQITDAVLKLAPLNTWALRESRVNAEQEKEMGKRRVPNDPSRAIEFLESGGLPNLDPQRKQRALCSALEYRAEQYIQEGKLKAAEADVNRSAAEIPDRPETMLLRAQLLSAQGKHDESLKRADQAAKAGAPQMAYVATVSETLLKAGRLVAAIQTLDQFLQQQNDKHDPRIAGLLTIRAETLLASGKRDAAFRAMKSALALSDRPRLNLERARIRVMKGFGGVPGLEEAIKGLEIRLTMEPEKIEAYLELAELDLKLASVYAGLSRDAEALEFRRRARRSAHAAQVFGPKDPRGYAMAAQAWLALSDTGPSVLAAKRALELGGGRKVPGITEKLLELVKAQAQKENQQKPAPKPKP